MWKIWCAVVLFVQLVAGAPKIGSMIGPMAKDPESMPLLTSFYTNLYAKIAREIVHDSSEKHIFRNKYFHFQNDF